MTNVTLPVVAGSFNTNEIETAVVHFISRAKTVKEASVEMHKALVILAADAFETGHHAKLRETVNNENVSLSYKTSIVRFLNTYLPCANAKIAAEGVFKFSFTKDHAEQKRPVRNDSEFMAVLFNHPFYEVKSGSPSPEELAVFDDEAVTKLIKNVFKRVANTATLNNEKLAKKGYSSVNVDFEKIEAAKAALKAIGIDVNDV